MGNLPPPDPRKTKSCGINKKRYTREKNKERNTFLSISFVTLLLGGLLAIIFLINPFEKEAKYYCYKLQDQAEDYKNFLYSKNNTGGFYVTQEDMQMCTDIGIIINAPTK